MSLWLFLQVLVGVSKSPLGDSIVPSIMSVEGGALPMSTPLVTSVIGDADCMGISGRVGRDFPTA
jgi:hypothetical protein